jgi:hypothetical protein
LTCGYPWDLLYRADAAAVAITTTDLVSKSVAIETKVSSCYIMSPFLLATFLPHVQVLVFIRRRLRSKLSFLLHLGGLSWKVEFVLFYRTVFECNEYCKLLKITF